MTWIQVSMNTMVYDWSNNKIYNLDCTTIEYIEFVISA